MSYNTKYMRIYNKRARYEYELTSEKVEAGVALRGIEARSLREGRGDLSQAHVRIMNGEAFLINANIPATGIEKYDPTRIRKLLLHRKELVALEGKMKGKKLQLVPIALYNRKRLVKLELALGKPKRQFEKKESLKQADIKRDLEREFKGNF